MEQSPTPGVQVFKQKISDDGRVRRSRVLILTLILGLAAFPSRSVKGHAPAAPPFYVLTDLGTLGGLSAQAYEINDAGHVVGYATNSSNQGRAFLWRNGVMTDLGTLGGPRAEAHGINESDLVAGTSTPASSTTFHATLWEGSDRTDLTPGSGGTAYAINDARQVVGTMDGPNAFLWEGGVITTLGSFGGHGSFGADINNSRVIVGGAYTNIAGSLGGLMAHAFRWQNNVMADLGILPGTEESWANSINDLGQIVGTSMRTDPETYEVFSQSFLFSGDVMTALPVPSTESYATDINDSGHVVGTMRAGGGFSRYRAYIYADGVVTNLNSLIPAGSGLDLYAAYGINSSGQIVGTAIEVNGRNHAFLLTPVESGTPVLSISDATVTEGHSGTVSANFIVTLSNVPAGAVTVSYNTSNGSASAGSDYQAASATLTFDPGQTSKTISVQVNGDRAGESSETFFVTLSQVSGAVVGDAQGTGTIVDDEPRLTITDVTRNEGNNNTTAFVFTVTLTPGSDIPVSVNFSTSDGSAKSTEDYIAGSGTLMFNPAQTSRTITVAVIGDRKAEGDELFCVNLSGATGGSISDAQGCGTIRNDDR
jgi:probable HAF family extracellular repeat protein